MSKSGARQTLTHHFQVGTARGQNKFVSEELVAILATDFLKRKRVAQLKISVSDAKKITYQICV